MYKVFLLALVLLGIGRSFGQAASSEWPNAEAAQPFIMRSVRFKGIEFSGRWARYGHADTWYPSWASDDGLYSPFMDGNVNGVTAMFDKNTTGQARIVGSNPLNLSVKVIGLSEASAVPYHGRYPSASLVVNGVWYYGTYTLDDLNGRCGNWCIQGPFVGFRTSTNYGQSWSETPRTAEAPLFERPQPGAKVRIGPAHFIDFGRNMQYSPDGNAYLIAHGTGFRDGFSNWIAGDDLYLARTKPSPTTINDVGAWEFYAGKDTHGKPLWDRRIQNMRPLLEWRGHLGSATITYDAPMHLYLLCVSRPADGFTSNGDFDTLILESKQITGPWAMVTYLKSFGPQAYFVNIPSKFISPNGRTFWLAYSANFSLDMDKDKKPNPPGSGYALVLREAHLKR